MKGVGSGAVIASSYSVIHSIIFIADFITIQVSISGRQPKISKDHLFPLTFLDQVPVKANLKVRTTFIKFASIVIIRKDVI